MVAPLTTAGVSDEVAQELQMPRGPQMLEDVEEPMPARPATLRDPGTPDQIVTEQHSLAHFPSQPWCKMRTDNNRKSMQLGLKIQFDYGYMGDGGALQIACFLLGAETSSGAFHATMVPDSKRMDMPMLLRQQPNRCVTWCMHASVYMETKEFLQLLRLEGQDWQSLRQVSPTQSHQSNGAAEKAFSTHSAWTSWNISDSSQRQNPVSRSDNTLSDASVDDQTRSMDSHSIQGEKRHE